MSEISILTKNLIKSYFEEIGYEDTPILDKFDKLIGKYLKGASCDACLTNLHGYLSEMWDKGLNEKLIHEFIEELTKYIDESTATKINKGLKFTESLEESNRNLKESLDKWTTNTLRGELMKLGYFIDDLHTLPSKRHANEVIRQAETVRDFCESVIYELNKAIKNNEV